MSKSFNMFIYGLRRKNLLLLSSINRKKEKVKQLESKIKELKESYVESTIGFKIILFKYNQGLIIYDFETGYIYSKRILLTEKDQMDKIKRKEDLLDYSYLYDGYGFSESKDGKDIINQNKEIIEMARENIDNMIATIYEKYDCKTIKDLKNHMPSMLELASGILYNKGKIK